MVMSVGLLAGSLTGAVMGFATGLLVDTVLVQTLGITSLLYIAIGYWAGRLRELRDPPTGWSRSPPAPPRPRWPGSG